MLALTEDNEGSEVFLSKCCPWFSWFPSVEFISDIRAIRGSFLASVFVVCPLRAIRGRFPQESIVSIHGFQTVPASLCRYPLNSIC